jgi:hypothetical protein
MNEEQFYYRQSYSERVTDNVGHWLGLQHLTPIDVVLLFPLCLPLIVFPLIIWLPWERWLWENWKNLPKQTIGMYGLYCAFVLWHIHAQLRVVVVVAIIGAGLCALGVKEILERRKRLADRSRD